MEEAGGGGVEGRAARGVEFAGRGDEATLKEGVDGAGGVDAADGFDGGAGDGLAVGDDGEHFGRGGGEALVLAAVSEPLDVHAVFGLGSEEVAIANLVEVEGAVSIFGTELANGFCNFFSFGTGDFTELGEGDRLGGGKEDRLNDFFDVVGILAGGSGYSGFEKLLPLHLFSLDKVEFIGHLSLSTR